MRQIVFILFVLILFNFSLAAEDSSFSDIKLKDGVITYHDNPFTSLIVYYTNSISLSSKVISNISIVDDKNI
jgi:hypothetical protein